MVQYLGFPGLLTAPGISLYADRFVVKQSAVLGIGLELDDVVRPRIRDKARPLAIELREPFLGRAVVDLHLKRSICIIRRAADQDAAVAPVGGICAIDHRTGTRIRTHRLGVDQMSLLGVQVIQLAGHTAGTAPGIRHRSCLS